MTPARRFELVVIPDDGDDYGIRVVVWHDDDSHTAAAVPPNRIAAIRSDIVAAVVSSGHRGTALHPNRKKPITLSEEAGVRLTLAILATTPIKKSQRIDAIRVGVDAMTSEEAFYWYAHITSRESSRALKALRILLAGG
ncbi:MAG: hypothetical protein M5U23_04310 [Acidimicrobiia bacterium]|nr:hypothetical protein [Acidimicrobiia bacterium]